MTSRRIYLDITTMGHRGVGIGRHQGKVILVPLTAPGDRVEVRVVRRHRWYDEAELVQVLKPSSLRREPPCPFYGRCGGCHLQHMKITDQRRIKGDLLREMLCRAGVVDEGTIAPVEGTADETAYRSRLELHVVWGAGPQLGFSARGSHRIVPIHQCLLGLPPIQRWIPIMREMLRRTGASEVGRLEISCDSPGEGIVALLWAGGRLGHRTASRLRKAASEEKGLRGLYFAHRRGGTIQPLWESASDDPGVRFSVPGPLESEKELTLTAWPGVFRQVNPEVNRLLVGRILGWARESGARRVLELHAGMGNLTLPLALETEEVMAVESDPRAVENARYNARRLGIGNIIWRRSPAKRVVRDLTQEGRRFDTIVLDPPRQGAREVLEGILKLKPDHIFYVSCDPSTLARDLVGLLQGGPYRVVQVLPLDMFPQTYHLETLSWLQRYRHALDRGALQHPRGCQGGGCPNVGPGERLGSAPPLRQAGLCPGESLHLEKAL